MTTSENGFEFSPAEAAAVAKAVKGDNKDITPGVYEIDLLLRIRGTVKKGEDHDSVVAQAAKPWSLLALALSKLNGVTVESLVKEFTETSEVDVKDIEKRAADALTKIKGKTRKTVSGKTTVSVVTTRVVEKEDYVDVEL